MEWVWGVFRSTINYALKFVYSVTAMKAVIFTAMYWIFKTIWDYALQLVASVSLDSLGQSVASIPAGALYFILVFRIDVGLPMILGAFIVRFTIRRLPVIG